MTMTPESAMSALAAGGLAAFILYIGLGRFVPRLSTPFVTAFAAAGVLLLCAAFFLGGRLVGVPEFRDAETTAAIVNSYMHWIIFASGLGLATWVLLRREVP